MLNTGLNNLFTLALKNFTPRLTLLRRKTNLTKSLVPLLNENDLIEEFIKGSGPGGSKVNKSSNCVFLKHIPSGLYVKVHECRELHLNRKIARKKLITMLDNNINGENSIENRLKKMAEKKYHKNLNKKKKLLERKIMWKNGLD